MLSFCSLKWLQLITYSMHGMSSFEASRRRGMWSEREGGGRGLTEKKLRNKNKSWRTFYLWKLIRRCRSHREWARESELINLWDMALHLKCSKIFSVLTSIPNATNVKRIEFVNIFLWLKSTEPHQQKKRADTNKLNIQISIATQPSKTQIERERESHRCERTYFVCF